METLKTFLGAANGLELAWIMVGLGGQFLFMSRFLVQWIASERAQRSVVPVAFWWISIGGAAVLLSYAIWRADPVFILGQSLGFVVYGRNLWLIYAEKKRTTQLGQAPDAERERP